VKSWAPAATLALAEVAPPFGTVPTTVTVFATVLVPQAVSAATASTPHAIAAPRTASVRAATARAYADELDLSSPATTGISIT
jgi:hypothetical protein